MYYNLDLFSTYNKNFDVSNSNYISDCENYYNNFVKCNNKIDSCPHCNSTNIVKNGFLISGKNKHKRYKCKSCNRTFSEVTTSPLSYSKKDISLWIAYLGCLAKGMTLKSISMQLNINIKTAFAWRHKILSSIENKIMDKELCHHVQIAEIIMRKNFKGNKIKPFELKKSRIINSQFTIPYNERIKIMSCVDDSENIILRGMDVKELSYNEISSLLKPIVQPKSILCAAKNFAYAYFAKQNNLKIALGLSHKYKSKNGEFLNNKKASGNGLDFIKYIAKFMGIATKYVNYYLALYVWEIKNRSTQFDTAVKGLFINLLNSTKVLRTTDFKDVTIDGLIASAA
ncbi:IS1/IS1595 family N-terminal zinc-binding domain-containing protein [Inconstantimicrobium mannanitabidum]|uniref:Uncharacterized protein n=1 Tax=Inconstantimicrobium mannanitabidum TaxID=1604901 RepID=A0ACB5RCF5_9CLOT|nr:hypothetical protein [Clostridium sp. TW13]GKX66952.1 hypothetical protein rsdtw13_22100 [Clostridium sp. TW13]